MRLFIGYISVITFVLLSCNNNGNKQYIEQIDSLSTQLENTELRYSTIDSIEIINIKKTVKDNLSKLAYFNDSSYNSLLISYGNMVKTSKQILKMDAQLKMNLQFSKTQISDLLHDAENNNIDTTLLIQYIEEEKREVSKLTTNMNYNFEKIQFEIHRFDSLNPLIEKLIRK